MEVPTFSTSTHALPESSPIRVDPKPKHCRRLQNVFLDDRGFPDQSDDYNHVLHGMDGGPILRKLWHPQPDLDAPLDPFYYLPFIAKKHEALMRKDMDLSHLDPTLQEKIYTIIVKIGLCLTERVCLFRSGIMNASSIPDPHGPSQSRKSSTASGRW